MTFTSETASAIVLLTRWRSLCADPRLRRELELEAQRCFRLAQSATSFELAEELAAIGGDFKKEAEDMANRMQAAAYQISFPGSCFAKPPRSPVFQQLKGARLF